MKETIIKVNGDENDRGEQPVVWWFCYISISAIVGILTALSMVIVGVATVVVTLVVIGAFVLIIVVTMLLIPIFMFLDLIIWLVTREHYFVHISDNTLAIGWKQGSKYQE